MTNRLGTKRTFAAGLALAAVLLAGCAGQAPRLAQGERGSVFATAPRMTAFGFNDYPPMAAAADFAPWSALSAHSAADQTALDACLADAGSCASAGLVRYRRMMELAAGLPPRDQLNLVHHYFNTVEWTTDTRDTWSTLYHTALTKMGDCEDVVIAKYQTLLRLGWPAAGMRMLIGWDGEERDWHALLAVRLNGETLILDSIKGLQSPSRFTHMRLVYSISDQGVWDHAPDFVPVGKDHDRRTAPERAARIAASKQHSNEGVLK